VERDEHARGEEEEEALDHGQVQTTLRGNELN
jgi:hypothetical protein